jgi:hypothetical protein
METKRSKVINAINNGDYIGAMKLAKGFTRDFTKEESTTIKRAYEMHWNEGFYKQLGFNKEEEYNKAVEILNNVYIKAGV